MAAETALQRLDEEIPDLIFREERREFLTEHLRIAQEKIALAAPETSLPPIDYDANARQREVVLRRMQIAGGALGAAFFGGLVVWDMAAQKSFEAAFNARVDGFEQSIAAATCTELKGNLQPGATAMVHPIINFGTPPRADTFKVTVSADGKNIQVAPPRTWTGNHFFYRLSRETRQIKLGCGG